MPNLHDTLQQMARLSLFVLKAIFPGGFQLAGTRISPFWILLQELRMMEVVVTS